MHDAVNLGWKLALQIRGLVKPGVLETYSPKRMTAVQKLINYDKDISILMSQKWPSWYEGDKTADPYLLLGEIFEQAASFNTGLGISHSTNTINQTAKVELAILPGSRPPDVHLTTQNTNQEVRFQRITRNIGKLGNSMHQQCPLNASVTPGVEGFRWVDRGQGTLYASGRGIHDSLAHQGCSPYEAMAMKTFGDLYFDKANAGHEKSDDDGAKGCIIVLRPDGLVGSSGPLDGVWVKEYFSTVLE